MLKFLPSIMLLSTAHDQRVTDHAQKHVHIISNMPTNILLY